MSAAVPGSNPPTVDTVTQGVGDVSLASGPPATGDSKSAAFTTSPQANGVAGASHSAAPSSVPAGSYIVTPVPGGGSQVTPVSPTGSALAAGAAPVAAPSATSPVSPVVGGAEGTAAHPSTLNTAASPTGSRLVSPASGGPAAAPASIAPTDVSAAGSTAAPAAAAVAPVMKEKDIKKYDKLLKTEAKSEEKNLKSTLKDAAKAEKAFRKAVKAEQQSQKRHQKAITSEHKTAKELAKADVAHEKAAAQLTKAKEELDIKARHKEATSTEYEKLKAQIETLRQQKAEHDRERASKAASVHGGGVAPA